MPCLRALDPRKALTHSPTDVSAQGREPPTKRGFVHHSHDESARRVHHQLIEDAWQESGLAPASVKVCAVGHDYTSLPSSVARRRAKAAP